jgi:inner membrane protein
MKKSIVWKLLAIGAVVLLLAIPILSTRSLVSERQSYRDVAVQEIARGSGLAQRLTGPVLVVTQIRNLDEWVVDDKTGQRRMQQREHREHLYFLPDNFVLDADLKTEIRKRGIYEARLFRAANRISGHFQIPANYGVQQDVAPGAAPLRFEKPFVALGVSDIRGIGHGLKIALNGKDSEFVPGTGAQILGSGVHALLPMAVDSSVSTSMDFTIELALQGTGEFNVTPIGRESKVAIKSDWPHPSFIGDQLPTERKVTDQGFTATWQTSFFATNMAELLQNCAQSSACNELTAPQMGVSIIDPVDQYLKTDRAMKYALLFIALTFAGFFLCEILKRAAVHPIQYGLVGLALAFFYVLLLSLAEHIGFALAYTVSALACISLLGYYIANILHNKAQGLGFAGGLAALYALLYGLLSAEDYALLMGSLLVFALLAAFMILTRRVDWFRIGSATLHEG